MNGNKAMGFWEEEELAEALKRKMIPPTTGTSVIKPIDLREIPLNGRPCIVTYSDGIEEKAIFRQFGIDYEMMETGRSVQYSSAIVELEDGTLDSVYVEQIKFTDREKKDD